jgi:hypothetical protein
MEEPPATGTPSGGQHYREIARKLREIARECRFPGARREIRDLASRLERRADDLDTRLAQGGQSIRCHPSSAVVDRRRARIVARPGMVCCRFDCLARHWKGPDQPLMVGLAVLADDPVEDRWPFR